jgi:hypothetical protein
MPAVSDSKYRVQAGWEDVPHIPSDVKTQMLRDTPYHLRGPRSRGDPSMGSGQIYRTPIEAIIVQPFALPDWWPRGYGLDVGWRVTAAIWHALDPESDILYAYAEHYRSEAEPNQHAAAINARGSWIPGFIDPASAGSSQIDGRRLIDVYRACGLNLFPADNAVEAGIAAMHQRLETGRYKVFSTLTNWQREYRLYRRDENGKIVKKEDHCMDGSRYLALGGVKRMIRKPAVVAPHENVSYVADGLAGY